MQKLLVPIGTIVSIIIILLVGWRLLSSRSQAVPAVVTRQTSAATPSSAPEPQLGNPTIDQIFSTDHSWIATLSANPKIRTMVVTGDIIPVRMANVKILEKNDFTYPYQKTLDFVKNADITFANLETPLMKDCKPTREGMVFCGDARHVRGLQYAGIDIVNLANNHTGNHNATGIEETTKLLTEAGIRYTGLGQPTIVDVKGKKIAFVGFSEIGGTCCGARAATEENIRADVAAAKKQADIVVAQFHWGVEYREDPDENQKHLGHLAVDAGADLVIGNHPHWVQGVEYYKGRLITYAHGNYVFDQMWSIETRQGVLGKYTFYDNQLIDVVYYPIVIEDYVQPRPANAQEKQTIIGRMLRSSKKLLAQ